MSQAPAPVIDRERGKEMLQNVKEALKELYYDPKFRGINVDARFKEAEKQIKTATSTWQINTIIAQIESQKQNTSGSFRRWAV